MRPPTGVTLQITLAPTDLPTARHTLPHQLRVWGGQVDEILLTVDLHRSRGKYGEEWRSRLPGLRSLLAEQCARMPRIRCIDVDYGEQTATSIGRRFFGGRAVPPKDCIGGPFYSFLFGLTAARHDHVLHLDSDMMFGGGSQSWVAEAVTLLAKRRDVVVCGTLPGPPTADGGLRSQGLEREAGTPLAYRAHLLSTRCSLVNRREWERVLAPLPLTRPPLGRALWASLEGNPPYDLIETIVSRAMAERGLWRVELLGRDPGMWSVHPLYRSQLFYELLPRLVQRVEAGDVPEEQRGRHDLHDSMIDWSSARPSTRGRLVKHAKLLAARLGDA